MIPRSLITAWRASAPWPTDAQVEQDLILSRAVVELFRNPIVAESLRSCSVRSSGRSTSARRVGTSTISGSPLPRSTLIL